MGNDWLSLPQPPPDVNSALRAVTPQSFKRDLSDEEDTFLVDRFLATAKETLTALTYVRHPRTAQLAKRIDTRLLQPRDLVLGASMMRTTHALWALEPKERAVSFASAGASAQAETKSKDKDKNKNTDKGAKLAVAFERFRDQPRAGQKRQILRLTTSNGSTIKARTEDTNGKTSAVRVRAPLPSEEITSIEVLGRGDPSKATVAGSDFWREVLRLGKATDVMQRLDASGIFYPLFHGLEPHALPADWDAIKSYWTQPSEEQYAVIERGRLDPSQKAAARAIAAPLEMDSRVVMVQGPPGTGKVSVRSVFAMWRFDNMADTYLDLGLAQSSLPTQTTVIGEFAKQWMAWSPAWASIEEQSNALASVYCVCQSNAATKNIATSLRRAGVPFLLLVSSNFYREWHEHMYGAVADELVLTSDLASRLAAEGKGDAPFLKDKRVILCTMDSLSSGNLREAKLFKLRPVHCLVVDEASQLVLGAYPHLLHAHRKTLGRLVLFGDDRQLAPYGADSLPKAVPSVFELSHLRSSAHTLTRSYRLPETLCAFVSRTVYGGVLSSGPGVHSAPLGACVRFVDVESGVEERVGTSCANAREASVLCTLVGRLSPTVDFRILAAYAAQRDLIEELLREAGLPWEGRVFTADAFQGQEADVVLLSLVRDGMVGNGVGFLANRRRVNVMLTRAKVGMYILSSKRFLVGTEAVANSTLVGELAAEVGEEGWCTEEDVLNGRRGLDLGGGGGEVAESGASDPEA